VYRYVKGEALLEAGVQAELGYDHATSSYFAVGFITGIGVMKDIHGGDVHVECS
jgi:hypothetical protein